MANGGNGGRDDANERPRVNAYQAVDDTPCVGAQTFSATKGLVGLEDAEAGFDAAAGGDVAAWDVDDDAPPLIAIEDGDTLVTSLRLALEYDTRDNILLPGKGYQICTNFEYPLEALGGEGFRIESRSGEECGEVRLGRPIVGSCGGEHAEVEQSTGVIEHDRDAAGKRVRSIEELEDLRAVEVDGRDRSRAPAAP